MKIKEAKDTLPLLLKYDIVPFLWGYQGVGKTQVVKQIAKDMGFDGFVHLHLATQEVGDLVGLLIHNEDGTVKHARPEWFPTTGRHLIFLDEANRAPPDVLQCIFSLITGKTIHTHKLSPECKIIVAGNYQSDEFNVTDTSDAALLSRFAHIHFSPTSEEFVVYAESKGATSVADFISENKEMLESKRKETPEIAVTPDRRAWLEMVAPLDEEDMPEEVRHEVYSGIVGTVAATSYLVYKKSNEKKIKLRDILKSYKKVRPKILALNQANETRFDALSAPLNELIVQLENSPYYLDETGVANLKLFFLDVPLELVSQTSKTLGKMSFSFKNDLLNDASFTKKMVKKTREK